MFKFYFTLFSRILPLQRNLKFKISFRFLFHLLVNLLDQILELWFSLLCKRAESPLLGQLIGFQFLLSFCFPGGLDWPLIINIIIDLLFLLQMVPFGIVAKVNTVWALEGAIFVVVCELTPWSRRREFPVARGGIKFPEADFALALIVQAACIAWKLAEFEMALSNWEDIVLVVIDCRIRLTTLVDKVSAKLDDSRIPVEPELDFLLRNAELEFLIKEIFFIFRFGRLDLSLGRSLILKQSGTKCTDRLLCWLASGFAIVGSRREGLRWRHAFRSEAFGP